MRHLLRSGLLLSLAACAANAANVHWQLNDVVFSDGGMAFGGFDYDAGTNTYSNINVTTTPGSVMTSGGFYASALPSATASSFNGASTVPVFSGTTNGLALGFSPALTAAGGTVSIISPAAESLCTNPTCSSVTPQRNIVSGTATAISTSSPKRWYFKDVIMTDGARAFGSFVFDANTGTYSSISITTTNGGAMPGTSYFNLNPSGGSGSSLVSAVSAASIVSGTTTTFLVGFAALLTNAGGTVNIGGAAEGICTSANCGTSGSLRFAFVAGTVSTVPIADDIKVLPQIAYGGSFVTTLVFTNPTGAPITCRITFWGEDGHVLPFPLNGGNPVPTSAIVVPAHSSKFLASSGTGPLVVGYAVAENVTDVGVTAVYRLAAASEATVVGVPTTGGFAMPFDETTGYDTGLALANLNGLDTAIEYLYFYDTTGNLIFTDSSHTLGPLQHESFSFSARYGSTPIMGQRGEVRVYRGVQGTPSGPAVGLTGMGVRVNVTSGIFTSLQTFTANTQ